LIFPSSRPPLDDLLHAWFNEGHRGVDDTGYGAAGWKKMNLRFPAIVMCGRVMPEELLGARPNV
jgi:hypothetical protein